MPRKHQKTRNGVRRVKGARASRARRAAFILGGILVVAGSVFGVYKLTRMNSVTVDTVTVSGGSTITPLAIQSMVEDILDHTYAGIVPYRFAYAVPRARIASILHQVPRVATVRVTQPSLKMLHVDFTEFEPEALWCDGEQVDRCMFTDGSGYAFADAPRLQGTLYPRVVIASSTPHYGTTVPSDADLHGVFALRDMLASYGIALVSILYGDPYETRYVFSHGGMLRAKRSDGVDSIIDRLTELLSSNTYATLIRRGFYSIDLRFGNRVYIRAEAPPDGEVVDTARLLDPSATSSLNGDASAGE